MKHDPHHPLAAYGLPTLAISIRQPWAWCIAHGRKDIENRSWPTPYRGPVLVHAAKRYGKEERQHAADIKDYLGVHIPDRLELGCLIGVVRISGCVDWSASRWFDGPWGFTLFGYQAIPPIPCGGALGFFRPVVTAEYLKIMLGDWRLPELESEY